MWITFFPSSSHVSRVEHDVSPSSVCTNHRASWQVHVANLVTWRPNFKLLPACSTTGRLPVISFFIHQLDPSPQAVGVQWSSNYQFSFDMETTQLVTSSLPITPGSSTQTNDIDCNGLPCEGAPSDYFWCDFNLSLTVWSQTGQNQRSVSHAYLWNSFV